MRQLVLEGAPLVVGGEVPLGNAPLAERRHHPTDQLPYAALALRRAERATEILGHHDVRGELRPGARHLDLALLEDRLAALALDQCGADVPLHLVVGVTACRHEVAPEPDAAPRRHPRAPVLSPSPPVLLLLLPRPLDGHLLHPPRLPRCCVPMRQRTGYSTICCAVNRIVTRPYPACNHGRP